MTDVELTRAMERCAIPNEGFPHASHLRVAWVYLEECASVDEACGRMAVTLRRFAASVGKPEKYHETITVFWIRVLAAARLAPIPEEQPGAGSVRAGGIADASASLAATRHDPLARRPGAPAPAKTTFEEVVSCHPELLDKDLLLAYYSRQRLASDEARASWVEPDRRPLAPDVTAADSTDSPGDAPDRVVPGRLA